MKRFLLFFLVCIPLRLFLAYIAFENVNENALRIFTLLLSLSWFYLYFTKSRMNAIEGGGKTWWHEMRLYHAILFMLYFIFVDWRFLLGDVFLGIGSFIFLRS